MCDGMMQTPDADRGRNGTTLHNAQMISGQMEPSYVVGMVLKKEKSRKHISDKLIQRAAEAGITIRRLDEYVSLEEQGRVDVILQKIRRREWEAELEQYLRRHPGTRVVDPPHATYPLRNRGLMLKPFSGPGWLCEAPAVTAARPQRIRCSVPAHATLEAGTPLAAAREQLSAAGMRYPLLAKSLWADGREGSHAIAVVSSDEGLRQLIEDEAPGGFSLPALMEAYVDHGTCLFKVYVLGEEAVMVTRPSLHLDACAVPAEALHSAAAGQSDAWREQQQQTPRPMDTSAGGEGDLGSSPPAPLPQELALAEAPPDLELICRVSAYPRARSWGKGDLAPKGHGVPPPPEWLWRQVAQRIRSQLGLNLFNFDLIRPMAERHCSEGEDGLVHLIDINYFPGYEKLAGYEDLMVRFLSRLRGGERQ